MARCMSGLPTHLEGYGENVRAINGPLVCHGGRKTPERNGKISVLHPSSFGLNSEFVIYFITYLEFRKKSRLDLCVGRLSTPRTKLKEFWIALNS